MQRGAALSIEGSKIELGVPVCAEEPQSIGSSGSASAQSIEVFRIGATLRECDKGAGSMVVMDGLLGCSGPGGFKGAGHALVAYRGARLWCWWLGKSRFELIDS